MVCLKQCVSDIFHVIRCSHRTQEFGVFSAFMRQGVLTAIGIHALQISVEQGAATMSPVFTVMKQALVIL